MKLIVLITTLLFGLSWANGQPCGESLEPIFEQSEFSENFNGLKIVSMDEVNQYSSTKEFAAKLRNKYFNVGAPWKIHEERFPYDPGNLYYRVMTLDKESLSHILKYGIEPDLASSWDGHYIASKVVLSYGVAAGNFRGGIGKVDSDHLILNIIFQFRAEKLPWLEGREPSKVAQRLQDTIPVEAISNIWAYDLNTNIVHHIGSRLDTP